MSQKCDKVKWILLKLNIDEKKNMEDYNVMKKWLFGGIGIMLLIILMGFTVADFAGNGLESPKRKACCRFSLNLSVILKHSAEAGF